MYDHYTAIDFILNKDFQQWVRYPSESGDAYWHRVALLYPHQEENIEVAKKTLLSLKFKPIPGEAIQSEKMLKNILDRIQEYEQQKKAVSHQINQFSKRKLLFHDWMKIAASIALMLGLLGGYYIWQNQQNQFIKTAYGETREVKLPDGSLVVLNANSSIQYASDWQDSPLREVWLEGEAYFKVVRLASEKQTNNNLLKKFIVHTTGLDIEVLGTEFNVHQREENAQVVLTEGKVKVSAKDKKTEEVFLEPGELVEYSSVKPILSKKVVDPKKYTLWQEHQLVFNGESLAQVAKRLKEIFGYEVEFANGQMPDYKFKGTVPSNDLDVLLDVLKNAYGIEIEKKGRKLIFQNR